MFSLEKTARRSKFVEWREVKQDVQLSDNKQSLSSLRKMARRSKLVERQQNTNRRLSSLRKTARRSKLVERQRTIKTFLPEETTLELPQAKRSRFVNSSLTVTLAAHFNETKRKTCLKHVKELFRLPGDWEYKNDPELQATANLRT